VSPTASVSPRRIERLLFAGFLGTFAYFQPGGGWNQNARFAQVRAIVEEGRLAIDSFLVYDLVAGADGAPSLRRAPVVRGEVVVGGERRRLGWPDDLDHLRHQALRLVHLAVQQRTHVQDQHQHHGHAHDDHDRVRDCAPQ
jgi:hypothetical protein